MRNRLATALILLSAASCSGSPPPAPEEPAPASPQAAVTAAAAAPAPKPAPPALRLSRGVVPVKARATLTLIPTEDVIKGSIEIDINVSEPSKLLWLNATGLTIDEASLEQGGASQKPGIVPGGEDFVGLSFERELAKGPGRIRVAYRGKVSANADRGVFRQIEGGETYLFTQFQNIEARKAFPCFDEPSFKHPWQITLRVKPSDSAFSNTPAVSEAMEDGFKVTRFAETQPLPAYLVAFAVGPFEVIDAGKAGRKGTPIRVIVPKGQTADAAFAKGSTAGLLTLLEDYFEIPYPYEKLDILSIPKLASFGAMENAGLVTIASRLSLARPADETAPFRRGYVSIMAHEIAHQWFGDYVTTAWWDDIWLNEGFATWIGNKISERAEPSWRFEIERVRAGTWAMGQDSLLNARKVRQEIETKDDIQNAFDGITYVKGASVLSMFEGWVGDEPFRKGIQGYLKARAAGTATSADFLADVSQGSGKDLRAAFTTFLDRPGVPIVSATLTCDKEKGASLSLAQERYLPLGSKGDTAAAPWQIPVCARYGDAKTSGRACSLLTEKTGELKLEAAPGAPRGAACPTWFTLKESGVGYYRAGYTGQELDRLLDKKKAPLSLPERISVIEDAKALVHNGKLSVGDALARVPSLAKDSEPEIVRSALWLAEALREKAVPEALEPKLARFISGAFGAKARALGWRAKPGDSLEERMLRLDLVPAVAVRGGDTALLAEADKLAWKWLDDPASLESDAVPGVLRAAASRGDRKLFDRLHLEVKKTQEHHRRKRLLEAMAAFRDPAIARDALAIVLTDELDVRDAVELLFQDVRNLDTVLAFLKQNIDALLTKLPNELQPDVIEMVWGLCDEKRLREAEAVFMDRVPRITGGPRRLAQVLEGISLCIAERSAIAPSLEAFLEKK